MKALTVILAALVLTAGLSARELTLNQALDLARAHAFALKKASVASDAARAAESAAGAERWPTLTVAASGILVNTVPTISLGPIPPRNFGSKDSYQTDIRANLPLWTGGRIDAGVGIARAGYELQQASAKGDTDRLILSVWNEFLGLLRAEQLVDAAEASRKRAEITVGDVQSLFEAGVADSIDLNDARLASVRGDAGVTQAAVQRRSAAIRLAVLTGLDPSDSLSVSQITPEPDTTGLSGSPQILPTKSELRAAAAGIAVNQARLKMSGADFFPTISAFGGYSYGKPNQDRFNNTWNDFWTVGANLNWSFNLGGRTSSKRSSARYDLIGSQIERDRIDEQLRREVRLAAEQVRLMLEKYRTSQAEYDLASNQYRLARDRHANGDLSSNRLLEIETDLTSAQSARAASLADYWLAVALWQFALGSPRLQEGF